MRDRYIAYHLLHTKLLERPGWQLFQVETHRTPQAR